MATASRIQVRPSTTASPLGATCFRDGLPKQNRCRLPQPPSNIRTLARPVDSPGSPHSKVDTSKDMSAEAASTAIATSTSSSVSTSSTYQVFNKNDMKDERSVLQEILNSSYTSLYSEQMQFSGRQSCKESAGGGRSGRRRAAGPGAGGGASGPGDCFNSVCSRTSFGNFLASGWRIWCSLISDLISLHQSSSGTISEVTSLDSDHCEDFHRFVSLIQVEKYFW